MKRYIDIALLSLLSSANAVKPMPTNPIVASNFKLENWFFHAQIDFLVTKSIPTRFNLNKPKIIPFFDLELKQFYGYNLQQYHLLSSMFAERVLWPALN